MKTRNLDGGLAAMFGLAGLSMLWIAGCASHRDAQTAYRPGAGIVEFRALATNAQWAIRRASDSLAAVEAQSNHCPSNILAAFSNEVHRLQVESVQVRAHSQAMQSRGDAYFQEWNENMARVTDPKVRALAESRRPLLQQSFAQVKSLSQQAREAFAPFLSGLRQIRNSLENDPASVALKATQDQIQKTKESGRRVDECLARIVGELDAMTAMLTPSNNSIKK